MLDPYGDRMKAYEAEETSRKLARTFPIYARLDGRSFSKFTKGMNRPFDLRFQKAMDFVTKNLVEQTHAKIGYVQSDEISLLWYHETPQSEPLFGAKTHKLTSVLPSLGAAALSWGIQNNFGSEGMTLRGKLPHFDCRVLNLPSKLEASNMILWRAMDCKKNSISMVAQSHFSHKELHGADQGKMLAQSF